MKYCNDSFHVCSPQAISILESDNAPPSSPVRETSDDKREERDHVRTEGESTENIPVNSNQMEESSRYIYVYYQKYCNFAGPAHKSMSVETGILFKIIFCLSVRLSIRLSVCLFVCLSLSLSVCLSVYDSS